MTGPQSGGQLEVSELRVEYQRDIEILRGVSIVCRPSQITVLIGPNGAGKSTLVRAITGMATVTGGCVTLDGLDITSKAPRDLLRLGIAYVPQERTVFPEMSVEENLQLGGWTRRRERAWLTQRCDEVMARFPSLSARRTEAAGNLSGGQQKLLEIARGLITEPRVLLLDEPTAGLSPAMTREVYEELRRLHTTSNVTVLLVDQNVREALRVASHVYALAMGRVEADGTSTSISARLDEIVRGWLMKRGSGVTSR